MNDVAARNDQRQSLDEREFGFWLFLMSDAIVFALLFATFVVMRQGRSDGPTGAPLFSLTRTVIETGLLLLSSISFGIATVTIAERRKTSTHLWLAVAALLGFGFLVMEIGDFRNLIAQGFGPSYSGFLSAFFTLIGTHGCHVGMGIVWIVILSTQMAVKGLSAPVISRIMRLGLFWHFLDIVWIGIYSIVFLPEMLR